MRILQFGRVGQVGRELLEQASAFGVAPIAFDKDEIDLADADAVERLVLATPDIEAVVNAAAYTAVDKCESEEELALAVNGAAPAAMARACAARGIPIVHISTDYVFDGTKPAPYVEDDTVNPRSAYGRTKLAGEVGVREACDRHIILRTSWVFARDGHNFVRTVLRLAREKGALRIVDDQRGCPTPAQDIAHALLATLTRRPKDEAARWGTFHFCGDEPCSWADLAAATLKAAGPQGPKASLARIATSEYPTPAERPKNSVMDCGKIARVYGLPPAPWRARLETHVPALLATLGT
ncbi:MAG: dTDP-4-dehydrorhamnose reductase [Alphaproteobacteria bacterium]|nr:dTDP-4-dehydrorhamnose reductase [Alphaproteobacteria bacterium]